MAKEKIKYFDRTVKRLFLCFCFISLLGGKFFANDLTARSRLPDNPDNSLFGDVWINEVMANPTGSAFPETEYVELYNTSNTDINLQDWTLIYYPNTNIPLPDVILPAGSYAVVHRAAKTIYVDPGGIAIPLTTFPSTLANAGRKLELTNSLGITIDSVTYKAATSGCSWERDVSGDLYLSYDPRGGTPGSVNSVKPPDYSQYGDIRINEIMVDPRGLTDFPETEYVELFNASNVDINLKYWTLIYNLNTGIPLPDVTLPAGGYAVVHRAAKTIYVDPGGIAIPITSFPSTLANAGRKLELTNSWDAVIDSVTYNAATSGCSWERDAAGNLYLSYDPRGGTPGSVNSVKPPDYSQYGDVLINEIMVDPRNSHAFPETEYIELFNTSNIDINLKYWILTYNLNTGIPLPDVILPAGGYAVVHRAAKTIYVDPGGIAIPIASFPSTLANAGRKLELTNSWDVLIDSVTYNAATSGCSWERDAAGNLYLSYDPRGGTPGSANSVKPPDYSQYGDVRINEIMVDPRNLNAFPETEYVELYNASHIDINLKYWTLIYNQNTNIPLPDVTLPAGVYAVLHRNTKTIHVDAGGIAIPIASFPTTLANAGRKLELINSWDVLIDSVTYNAATSGCSWERDAAGNLYLSYDPRGGTPGSINSVKPPDYSRYGDIRINEIMVDPRGLTAFPETEYIELYNVSNNDINLKYWTLIYNQNTNIPLPDVTLPASGYAVVHRAAKTIYVDPGGIAIPIASFPSTLANAGRKLELINSWDVLIDSVTYIAATTGCSWERDATGNLYLSYDPRGGTPGSVNSVKPPDYSRYGDVVINEIMADPRNTKIFPETEYVELYNVTNGVINLKGWVFTYDERMNIVLPDTILPPGGYAILYRTGKDIHIDAGGIAIPIASFPSTLANAGRKLELTNSWDVLIDSVTYKSAETGCSWERDEAGNLYLSYDPRGGTPGSVNSVKPPDDSRYGDVWINEVMADPRGLTTFPETEYVELHNASNTVINLKEWTLIYDERVNIKLPDILLPVGGYAVLHRTGKDIHLDAGGIAIPIASFPTTLANTGRKLELTNSWDVLIDSITYKAATAGCSWERDASGNLYLSTDPRGGTPGSINSPRELPFDPSDPDDPYPQDDSRYNEIIINEIMANPSGLTAFPETEYVELYNTSEADINTKGWSFIYDTRSIALPDVIIPADGYAVLYRADREIYIDEGGIAIPIATFPTALANTGRYVAIQNTKGVLIDSITYQTAVAGWAWERDPDGSLYLSNNPRGGTPGSANSSRYNPDDPMEASLFVNEKEWIFNELLPEQKEGGSEYIELYNRSNRTLFLSGLSIATRRSDGALSTRYSLSAIKEPFRPGEYIVLTTNRNGVLDFYYTPSPHSVYELRLPALNNTGATLVLFRTNDESAIDEVSYLARWHDQFIRNTKGVALERINPDADTQNPTNWTSAISEAGYGTPGYKNSQNGTLENNETIQTGIPEYRDGYGDYIIRYQVDKSGYHCRMDVYSLEGQKVAEINNNQLMGFEGEITWTGTSIDGSRLRPGIYIFYTEVYHPDGLRKNDKKVFLMKP